MAQEYAAYRGDQLIISGTLLKVARFLGIKTELVIWLCTPTAHARRKGSQKALLIYRVDDA